MLAAERQKLGEAVPLPNYCLYFKDRADRQGSFGASPQIAPSFATGR
jgi:hypothetical protein